MKTIVYGYEESLDLGRWTLHKKVIFLPSFILISFSFFIIE